MFASQSPPAAAERLVPPALRAGDAVGVIAPAGPVNRERLERALARIEARGLRIKTYRDLFHQRGFLAGDDDLRVSELNTALADPETAAVLPARGGYGCARLLERIDYAAVRRRPKIVAGFSDLTALHAALASQTGLATLHSPNLVDGWGDVEPPAQWVEQAFWRLTGLTASSAAKESVGEVQLPAEAARALSSLAGGVAEGRLIGGNVAVFAALVGSPYLPDPRGAILLLEDVGEQPYRLDRMLAQLKLAGFLDRLAGVLLGQFTNCDAQDGKPSLTLEEVFADYLLPLGVPVLAGFPTGHVRENLPLPLRTLVRLDADRRALTIVELPVSF